MQDVKTIKINDMNRKKGYWAMQVKRMKKHRSILWFILPAVLLSFVFGYIPMLGISIAFTDNLNHVKYENPIQMIMKATFTFRQFTVLFNDPAIVKSIVNTLIINAFKLGILFPLTIITAILLSEIKKPWLSKLIIIVLCLPNFLSWSVVVGIWQNLLHVKDGTINNILIAIGIIKDPIWFLGQDAWFKPLVIFLAGWKSTGWSCIIFYAAIMSIDKSYYEAAEIDGINKFQKARHLTLPHILPTVALMLVLNITYIMDAGFEQIYAMMNFRTQESQETFDTYIYRISLINRDYSFAAMVGIVKGLVALFLMIIGNKIVKKTLKTSLW